MAPLHAIIMAGGSGTRFWPASRARRPKQLLPLANGKSLLEATVARVRGLAGHERTWIVTNALQAPAIRELLADLPPEQVLVEPEARDTAPCIALAAARVESREPGAVMVVLPADHVIEPLAEFERLLRRGAALAADGRTLVTFGIHPTRPATGYGYIEQGTALDRASPAAFAAVRFREKPDPETARQLVQSGKFLWNSGIFVWTTDALLAAMDHGAPDLAACTRQMIEAARNAHEAAFTRAFLAAPRLSIDYAVMEKATHVAVVRAELQWDDLGSFLTLGTVAPADAAGNVVVHAEGAQAVLEQARDCVVYAEGPRTVCLFGVRDLVVVAVGDATLVCTKDRADDLKVLIKRLRDSGRSDLL